MSYDNSKNYITMNLKLLKKYLFTLEHLNLRTK